MTPDQAESVAREASSLIAAEWGRPARYVPLAGKRWRVCPLTLRDLACIEQCAAAEGECTPRAGGIAAVGISKWVMTKEGASCVFRRTLRRKSMRPPRRCVGAWLSDQLAAFDSDDGFSTVVEPSSMPGDASMTSLDGCLDWAQLLRHFASKRGWQPQAIGRLTLAEALALLGNGVNGRRWLTRQEWHDWQAHFGASSSRTACGAEAAATNNPVAQFIRQWPELFAPLSANNLTALVRACARAADDRPHTLPRAGDRLERFRLPKDRGLKTPRGRRRMIPELSALVARLESAVAELARPAASPHVRSSIAQFH